MGLPLGQASTSSSIFSGYDIIALTPTTPGTLSVACLTHSQPSALTAHVISLPLTLPRLPFHLKHTLIRTAVKNGAVFEINYSGAFGSDSDGFETVGVAIKRNWWAAAREVIRVTNGKGVIVSGGITNEPDLRAPRDIINLYVNPVPALTRSSFVCSKTESPCWAWLQTWLMVQWVRCLKPLSFARVSPPTCICLGN